MALSVVDIYRDYLPKTNCRECGHPSCLAFAGMVISSKYPLEKCPYIPSALLEKGKAELQVQYQQGKWLKKDMAEEALAWASQRSASMEISELPPRIGGTLVTTDGDTFLKLPYFNRFILLSKAGLTNDHGDPLNRWEQVFIYNHLAMGGSSEPTGILKSFKEFPNTVSKIKSMVSTVEEPIQTKFAGKSDDLILALTALGGIDAGDRFPSPDVAFRLDPFPRVPVVLLFWDKEDEDDYGARVSLLFDETITQHLDIESILFLSETIKTALCSD